MIVFPIYPPVAYSYFSIYGGPARSLSSRFMDSINVLDAGLKNDGTLNTADMVAFFLSKLSNGKRIDVPAGRYVFDSPIIFSQAKTYINAMGSAQFVQTGFGLPLLVQAADDFNVEGLHISYENTYILNDDLNPYRAGVQYNSGILQIQGQGTRIRKNFINGFCAMVGYHGNQDNTTDLSGDLIVEDCEFNDFEFGVAPRQFNQAIIARNKSKGMRFTGVNPPHVVYVVDRTVARSQSLIITQNQDIGSLSGAYKVRNVSGVVVTNNIADSGERDIEIESCDRAIVNDNMIMNGTNDVTDSQRYGIGFRDCIEFEAKDNMVHINGGGQRGFLVRSATEETSRGIIENNRVIYTETVGDSTAAYVALGTADILVKNVSFINNTVVNKGDATPTYPFIVDYCDNTRIIKPRLEYDATTPPTGVNLCTQIRSNASNTFIEFDPMLWGDKTATLSSAIADGGTNSVLRTSTGLDPNGQLVVSSLDVKTGGSVTNPVVGISIDPTPSGLYRPGSNTLGIVVNGVENLRFVSDKTYVLLNLLPITDGDIQVGGSNLRYKGLYTYRLNLGSLSSAPLSPVMGDVANSDGTLGTSNWGTNGAGLYRWNGTSWIHVGLDDNRKITADTFQSAISGTASAPVIGIGVDATPSGLYRPGSNTIAIAANGVEAMRFVSDKVYAPLSIFPFADNGSYLGGTSLHWKGIFTYGLQYVPLSSVPSGSSVVRGYTAYSDGTVISNGWGASGEGLYRYTGSTWVFVG